MTAVTETDPTPGAEIKVSRNGRLASVIGVLAAILALAFLMRSGGVVDIALGVVLLALAGYQGWTAWDARMPVLLADAQGVRIRLGATWAGLPWHDIDEVEHLPRRSWWRDGRLIVLPEDEASQVATLGRAGRRQAGLAGRLYGAPFAVPLGLGTIVEGGSRRLSARLADLAGERATIVEIDPSADVPDGPVPPGSLDEVEADAQEATELAPASGDVRRVEADLTPAASPTPSPLRQPIAAVRAEVTRDLTRDFTLGANALKVDHADTETDVRLPEADELRPARDLDWESVAPIVSPGAPATVLGRADERSFVGADAIVDGVVGGGSHPAADPVIGPQLAAARERLGLTVDQLAERTRIRPHVIESIDVDDFAPCGGDFYARGHLRTLGRVLGVDAAPLLASYDERYADAPINPRRVFEAELATGAGGPIRRMKGGPNWSVLVAAVMAIVLAWSIARLVFDGAATTPPPAPSLGSGSEGTGNPYGKLADPVPVAVTAAGGGAHVVVRDGGGTIVFTGDLAFGETKTFQAAPPVRVQSSDGSATVSVDGGKTAALGTTGEQAQRTFTVE